MKKRVCCLMMALLLLGAAAGCGTNANEAKDSSDVVVRIATMGLIDGETLAYQEGYLEKYIDADVEFIKFDQSRDVVTALASGSVDIGECGSVGVATALAQGLEAKVIWMQDVLGDTDGLATKRSQSVENFADLAGKTVAFPFGSTVHYAFYRAAEHFGVDVSTINVVDMTVGEIPAAWETGQIDATYLWEPTLSNLSDSEMLLTSRDVASYGHPVMDISMVRNGFAEEYPELVVGYTKAVNEKAATSIASALEMGKEETLALMDRTIYLDAREQISEDYMGTAAQKGKLVDYLYDTALFLYEQNSISEMPDKEVFTNGIDSSFAEQALSEANS